MTNHKKVLITGANGFIGTALIQELEKKYRIYSTDKSCSHISDKHLSNFIEWDFSNFDENLPFPRDLSVVIHLMHAKAKDDKEEQEYFICNIKSTLDLLEFGKKIGIKYFIFTSSGSIYDYSLDSISEDVPNIKPKSMLGITKYCSELLANKYRNSFKVCILRLFYPYGINTEGRLLHNLITNIYNNKNVDLNTYEGHPFINPLYIMDLVAIIKWMVNHPQNDVFNVAGEEIISIKQLSLSIGKMIGKYPKFNYLHKNETLNLLGDSSKLLKVTKYKYKYSLLKGIREMIKAMGL